jgi:predicted PurR-regulated permease PerM
MLRRHTTREQVGFYLLLAVLVALSFWLIRSYLDIIAFSLMAVVIVKPLYDRILRWVRGRTGLAVSLTLVAIALAIVVPLWLAMNIISGQLQEFIAVMQQPGGAAVITAKISAALKQRFGAQLPPEQQQQLNNLAVSAATWLAGRVVNLGMAIPDLISRLFIFTGILGTLLPNYHETVRRIKQLSPLDDRIDDIFLNKIKLTIWAMFLAIFVIAVAQGLLMGLFIWLAGVPFTSLWTVIAVVAAMLPLGASLVALPLGGVQLLLGNYTSGVIVLAGYLLVVSNLDSFIRPRLVPKEANLNFVLVLLSALGGYQLFGFFGVVYGPVLMILLLTALEVYLQEYAGLVLHRRPLGSRQAWLPHRRFRRSSRCRPRLSALRQPRLSTSRSPLHPRSRRRKSTRPSQPIHLTPPQAATTLRCRRKLARLKGA